jgi:hypothetical protein
MAAAISGSAWASGRRIKSVIAPILAYPSAHPLLLAGGKPNS